jgi:thiamine biosynthesis lipoprotein
MNRKFFKNWIIRLLFIILLAGCQSSKPLHLTVFTQNIMTIDYRILVGHLLNPEQKLLIQEIIQGAFSEINAIYNKWNPHSEISLLNRLKAYETVTLSPQLYHFFSQIDQIVQLSEGRFDPTIEPLQQLWKTKLEAGFKPTPEEIEILKSCVGWDKIHFQEGVFYKEDSRTSLDLGGIAKGLCVDLLVERLKAIGFHHLYVEWGGEIRTSGAHPTGRPWQIYIRHFNTSDPNQAIAFLSLQDQAIATSGDYFQFWTVQDQAGHMQTYCHLFNPQTLSPLLVKPGSIASVSLVAKSCIMADGLAKVAMLFDSMEESKKWIEKIQEKYPDITFWLATR